MVTQRALPGLLIAVLVTVALGSVVTTAVGLQRDSAPEIVQVPDRSPSPARPLPETEAAAVLAAWDADRSEAWAAGDVRRLRALYTPGSVAGQHDVSMLRRWLDRGVPVEGLHTQVLAVRELARDPHRWELAVTDRVVGGTAGRVALPDDAASSWTVVLRREDRAWLVASVAPR